MYGHKQVRWKVKKLGRWEVSLLLTPLATSACTFSVDGGSQILRWSLLLRGSLTLYEHSKEIMESL